MADLSGRSEIEAALDAVGELVDAAGERYAIVVIGGAALNLRGIVARTTRDVDIIAFASSTRESRQPTLRSPPEPLPDVLVRAVQTVARDFNLSPDWLNTAPSLQLAAGLPRGFAGRITWRNYGGLRVGLAGREDLICLKLFAAADQRGGRHIHDLLALAPTDNELDVAARWVKSQDANTGEFPTNVDAIVSHVRKQR